MRAVGKTEVLCADSAALKKLKTSASEIDASEVYPSFQPALPYTLFFFDVRDEFLDWLNLYAAAWPASRAVDVPHSSDSGTNLAMTRRFGFAEASMASIFLVLISALLVWGAPKIARPDIISSRGSQRLALPIAEQPALSAMAVLNESSPAAVNGVNGVNGIDTITKNSADSGSGHSDSGSTGPTISIIETMIDTAMAVVPKPAVTSMPAISLVARPPLKVWFVDVGQGDGIILKLPDGKFFIIDSNQGSGDKMADLLASLGCREIEAMVMTHPHADHLGGLAEILARFPVRRFYDPGIAHPTAGYRSLLLAVEKNGCAYTIPKTGQKLDWDGSVTVTVLSAGPESGDGVNNASIVLRVEYGRTAMIFTGDAEAEAEQGIVTRFAGKLRADLLKVGHHGSHSSSTPAFLREVAPRFAVISCGIGNTYGHPAPITLTNLAGIGANVFRTDEQGTIMAESDGREIRVKPLASKASER